MEFPIEIQMLIKDYLRPITIGDRVHFLRDIIDHRKDDMVDLHLMSLNYI